MVLGAHMAISTKMNSQTHHMMAWLSPSFPTGAFAYSHGLEYAIYAGDVKDAATLREWLEVLLTSGSAWNDAVLLCHAYRGENVAQLASALAGSKERFDETWMLGRAYARTVSAVLDTKIEDNPLPIVMGQSAVQAQIDLETFAAMSLHAFAANLVSAAIRLVPLGQTDGQRVLHGLFPLMDQVAKRAVTADLSDLSNMAWRSDIAAMKHETLTTRIFRS